MKNYIRYIFIIFCFLFSLIFYNSSETFDFAKNINNYNNSITTESTDRSDLYVNLDETENSIVASNSQNHEISSVSNDRKDLSNSYSDKASAQNKIFQNSFNLKFNKFYWSISHKISPYLKNEICTRAP